VTFMRIEMISSDRILISLEEKDLIGYSLTFEDLSLKDDHSRKVLSELMRLAEQKTGLCFHDKRVLIEALGLQSGCLLLLTILEKRNRRKFYRIKKEHDFLVYVFDHTEEVLRCMETLYRMKEKPFQSTLYLWKDRYYLVIRSAFLPKDRYYYTIAEFARFSRIGKALPILLSEHAKCLAKGNAVAVIGEALL